jgi:hypothetical protein
LDIIGVVAWEVEFTDEFEQWWNDLSADDQDNVRVAINRLVDHGPALGRPWVDTVKGSRHHNMKELRPRAGNVRILFAFDPRRMAILLLGGDKTNRWQEWYAEMLPVADRLYDGYLEELRQEGLIE